MEHDRFETVSQCIREAAQHAAAPGGLSAPLIERFLSKGEETWDGAGSGRFTLAGFNENEAYTRASKTTLRSLFGFLAELLPAEARTTPQVVPATMRRRIEPVVKGLVQEDWQEVALRELTARTFVLNFQGPGRQWMENWRPASSERPGRFCGLFTSGYGLKPEGIDMKSKDPYSDVSVHETAHLLHEAQTLPIAYPPGPGAVRRCRVPPSRAIRVCLRGLFPCRPPRQAQVANRLRREMYDGAFSFPRSQREEVAALVLGAARSRHGWRVICEATVMHRLRRRGPKP